MTHLFKHARLWKAQEASLSLHGAVDDNLHVHCDAQGMAKALSCEWGSLLQQVADNPKHIAVFVKEKIKPWDFTGVPPSFEHIRITLEDSMP